MNIFLKVILVQFLFGFLSGEKKRYDGYSFFFTSIFVWNLQPQCLILNLIRYHLLSVVPKTDNQLELLISLDENLDARRNDNNQSVEVDSVTGMLPTQGYTIKSFSLYDLKRDVGGQKSLRHCWRKYYTTSQGYVIDALVYVIDSSDRRRIAETGNNTPQSIIITITLLI